MAVESLENLKGAVIEYDTEGAASWARKILKEKIDPTTALDALTETIRQVGDRFGGGGAIITDFTQSIGAVELARRLVGK